jgi:methylated-DNA-[protein]-cysteine S-methyltransferase
MPFAMFETPIGPCALAWSDDGVTWLQLPEETPDATRARLLAKRPDAGAEDAKLRAAPKWVKRAMTRVREHLAGKPQPLAEVPLDLSRASAFDTSTWPPRTTRSHFSSRPSPPKGKRRSGGFAIVTATILSA